MRTLLVAGAAATLFFLELHTGQRLAPVLGGGALVWLTTVVGFQLLLLMAYASRLVPLPETARTGAIVTALVLGASLGTASTVGIVLLGLALPTFLPGVLARGAREPVATRARWIAVSNVGAFVGLASYALLEPFVGIRDAGWLIRASALALALGLAVAVASWRRAPATLASIDAAIDATVGYRPAPRVLLAAAAGVVWYMSLHARLEATLPASPQLWATTLGLYLLSFTLPFLLRRDRHWRALMGGAALLALVGVVAFERRWSGHVEIVGAIALLAGCTAAHAALRARFEGERPWTHGALDMAIGGAAAGALVLVALPLVITTAQQSALAGIVLVAALLSTALPTVVRAALVVAALAHATAAVLAPDGDGELLRVERSWYGEFRVRLLDADSPLHAHRALYHQQTVHGAQYLDPRLLDLPTAYYSIYSGAGIALRAQQRARTADAALRWGVVGLGTGAVATYADANDSVRFFELDPRNVDLVTGPDAAFTFASRREGHVDFVVGDGRRGLDAERRHARPRYDALLLDAFSGGNVPTHMLTREAFELYAERVRDDGWILVHTSNHVLDLRPVVYEAARAIGARAVFVRNQPRPYVGYESEHEHLVMRADWIVLGFADSPWDALDDLLAVHERDEDVVVQRAADVRFEGIDGWTDDRRSVWPLRQERVGARERWRGR